MNCRLNVCAGAGLYNETAFRGLDFVLDQASQYGVKVMFTLANNWKTFDSKYNVSPMSAMSAEPSCHALLLGMNTCDILLLATQGLDSGFMQTPETSCNIISLLLSLSLSILSCDILPC